MISVSVNSGFCKSLRTRLAEIIRRATAKTNLTLSVKKRFISSKSVHVLHYNSILLANIHSVL